MKKTNSSSAYSLIEVIIAGAILMIAIGAVAAMAMATVTQQETNIRISQAISYQEQAARLYQLGLTPAAIDSILPVEPGVTLAFRNETIGPIGTIVGIQRIDCEIVFQPNPATAGWSEGSWVGGTTASRTIAMIVVRPSIR